MDHTEYIFQPLQPNPSIGQKGKARKWFAAVLGLGMFGAGLLFMSKKCNF